MASNQGNNNQGGNKQGDNKQSGNQSSGNKQSGNQGGNRGSQGDTSNRGFASMDPQQQREIAAEGGRAAHAAGTAHEFTSEEARRAGSMSHKNDTSRQSGSQDSNSGGRGGNSGGNSGGDSGGSRSRS